MIIETVRNNLENECISNAGDQLQNIEEEIIKLQEAALKLHKSKQEMKIGAADYAAKVKEYGDRMKELEEERKAASQNANRYTEFKVILDAFEHSIKDGTIMSAQDTAVMRSLIEQIIVKDDEVEIEFRCGVTVRHEYVK